MWRLMLVTTIALLGVGGWYASANYKLEVHRHTDGSFQYMRIVPRAAKPDTPAEDATDQPPAAPLKPTIHVATFNLDGLDDARLANPKVCESLVRILSRFDVVALQNVSSNAGGLMMRLKDQINATGRSYDFVTRPPMQKEPDFKSDDDGTGPSGYDATGPVYNAFLFDATTVEVDHSKVHFITVPPGMVRARPLAAEFRVRGPAPKEAFSFALVNVLVEPPGGPQDMDLLARIFVEERDRGLGAQYKGVAGEDDIILLGDLETDTEHLGRLAHVAGMTAAVHGVATTVRGTRLADNILFALPATVEFTGRSGVVDMAREFDLTPQEALEVSSHLPVWAEFSSYEGGQAGHGN